MGRPAKLSKEQLHENRLKRQRMWRAKNKERRNKKRRELTKLETEDERILKRFKQLKRYHERQGSVFIDNGLLVEGLECSPIPNLPDGVYEWKTESIKLSMPTINHTLSVSDGNAKWELVFLGSIGIHRNKIHVARGPEVKLVANCRVNPNFAGDIKDLASYFEWFVCYRVILPNFGLDDQYPLKELSDTIEVYFSDDTEVE
jgi:hypothetical protein